MKNENDEINYKLSYEKAMIVIEDLNTQIYDLSHRNKRFGEIATENEYLKSNIEQLKKELYQTSLSKKEMEEAALKEIATIQRENKELNAQLETLKYINQTALEPVDTEFEERYYRVIKERNALVNAIIKLSSEE